MNMQKVSLGFSSCPNDTFIFDAMVHHKIDTEGLEFEVHIGDVEELNRMAFNSELDITKISFNAYLNLVNDYVLLDSGAALGENCGPLIISNSDFSTDELVTKKVAIPGKNTTANLLYTLAFPKAQDKEEMIFSAIEEATLKNKVDAGLIIHESRFTYEEKGLKKIIDLGEWWEKTTQSPTPLGGIIAKRNLDSELLQKINRVMRKSVQYAFDNPKEALPYIKYYAQEMEEEVMYKHIGLYVNDYTLELGENGKKAVHTLVEKAAEAKLIQKPALPLFID
jgi:1,4-dihydroxy-6-naphthoate synthase